MDSPETEAIDLQIGFFRTTSAQREFDSKAWRELTSYFGALSLSCKHIEGKMVFSTPFEGLIIMKEYLRSRLLEMHTYGLLLVDFTSHNYVHRGVYSDLWEEELYRGSIRFIVSEDHNPQAWKTFRDELCKTSELEVCFQKLMDDESFESEPPVQLRVETRRRGASLLQDLEQKTFEGDLERITNVEAAKYRQRLDTSGCQAISNSSPVIFLVTVLGWDTINDKTHLDKIIEAAKVSGLLTYRKDKLGLDSKNDTYRDEGCKAKRSDENNGSGKHIGSGSSNINRLIKKYEGNSAT